MVTSYQMKKIVDYKRKKKVGALGEALVAKHLKSKGFTHVESNFLRRQGELDLVMKFGDTTHFIEVKTVSRVNFQPEIALSNVKKGSVTRETSNHLPEENVSPWKMTKIARVVQIYLSENHLHDKKWQFHVAVVYLDQNRRRAYIKLIKDIPLAG